NADCRKASAAIIGAIHSGIEDVDAIGGTGIGKDVGVVEGALAILAIAVHQRPVFSAVVGAKEPAAFILNQRPHASAVVGRSDADASCSPVGQSMRGEPLPGAATVGAAIET